MKQDARTRSTRPVPVGAAPQAIRASGSSRPTAAEPTVLIVGAYRQSLAVARSLRAAGLRVILGRVEGTQTAWERSRAIDGVWEHPPVKRQQAFASALETLCRGSAAPDYLFPLGDDELALVAALAPLGLPVSVVAVAPDVLERCQNKDQLLEIAKSLGVSFPPCERVATVDALRAAAPRIGYPLVLKAQVAGAQDAGASAAFIGGKALILGVTPKSSRRCCAIAASPRRACSCSAKRAAPGTTSISRRGAVSFGVMADTLTLRTDRHDGTGLAVEGISVQPLPELVEQTARLVRELGYTGIGCAQFLVDPRDGSTCFLEINARLGANCASVIACGLDLPKLFVDLMHGDVPTQRPAKVGRHFAWFSGDLDGLLDCRRNGSIGASESLRWFARMTLAQCVADNHITFQWRDPLPAIHQLLHRFATAVAHVFRLSAR